MTTEKIIVFSSGWQKTINNVNPNATNAQLATVAAMLTALTNCTYQKTDRITKVNCDTEPGGGTKPEPTLTLSKNTCTKADVGKSASIATITTNSDGVLYARFSYPMNNWEYAQAALTVLENETPSVLITTANGENEHNTWPQIIYIGVTETDNFQGKEVAYTITES